MDNILVKKSICVKCGFKYFEEKECPKFKIIKGSIVALLVHGVEAIVNIQKCDRFQPLDAIGRLLD